MRLAEEEPRGFGPSETRAMTGPILSLQLLAGRKKNPTNTAEVSKRKHPGICTFSPHHDVKMLR